MIILGTNSIKDTGYDVANSLRFNDGSSDYLNKTHSSGGGTTKATYSGWIKKCTLSNQKILFMEYESSGNYMMITFETANTIRIYGENGGAELFYLKTNALYRDPSAWMHIVVAFDSTQGTSTNRIKLYINGVQETSLSSTTYPSQNANLKFNQSGEIQYIGAYTGSSSFFDGYMSEIVWIDNQALDPTSFGEFDEDSGIWKPKDVSDLTFGTNGFYLEFKGSGTSANSSGLGADTSGNDLHFTVGNLTAVDQSIDTCTNNFATMNPLDNKIAGGTFAEGNLQVTSVNTGYTYNTSTFGVASGKWYWEVKWSAQDTGSSNQVQIGIAKRVTASATTWLGSQAYTYAYQGSSGHVLVSGGNATGSSSTTYAVGDIISVALDLDNNKIHFAKNGTYTNSSDAAGNSGGVTITAPDSTSGDSGFYFAAFGDGNDSLQETGQFNFGSPIHAISSGNTDGNGYGNFEYAVPSGYFSLNTKNLAEHG